MTPAQLTTFKNAILSDANLAAARLAGDHGAISTYYNGNGVGNIWRPYIAVSELNTAIVWSEFAALSVQFQNCYFALIQGGAVDATKVNIRNGFGTVFTGTSLTNLTALAQRLATKFEALFTTANVCVLFAQTVTPTDVAAALGS